MFRGPPATGSRVLPLAAAAVACSLIASACRDVPVDPFTRLESGGTGGAGAGGTGGAPDAGHAGGSGGAGGAGGSASCPITIVGFAAYGGLTTGGGDSTPTTVVSTLAALTANAALSGDTPVVIVVKGMITVPPGTLPINVESNKTITGLDAASGLTGGAFMISGTATAFKENVIIRNMIITPPTGNIDAITVQYARHVVIDHNDLSSTLMTPSTATYGWLVNVKHASDDITVSWNRFHDHYNTAQIGHSDSNMAEDTGHLTVTYHHNLFQLTNSGTPRVRFGNVHVFNNHYTNAASAPIGVFSPGGDYAIASQMYAQVFAEKNVFEGVSVPITNQHELSATSFPGQIKLKQDSELMDGNFYDRYPSTGNQITPAPAGTAFTFNPGLYYDYTADSTDTARFIVDMCAGPLKP